MMIDKLPPFHEIDTRYTDHVFQIMEDCADERVEGWTKPGLLVNQSPDNPNVLAYIAAVWRGEKYDKWFPELALKALADAFYDWQQELIVGDFPKWAAMFFGTVLQSDGNVHTLWLPGYTTDYGAWRVTRDAPNWSRVKAEFDKLLAREQGQSLELQLLGLVGSDTRSLDFTLTSLETLGSSQRTAQLCQLN